MTPMYGAAVDIITPEDLGFPSKFKEFRSVQRDIARFALNELPCNNDGRMELCAISAPVGCGKTLAVQLAGMLSSVKFGVLTGTKGLQDQVANDGFPHLADIRGRANYPCCHEAWAGQNCEDADEDGCPYSGKRSAVCTYNAAYALAAESRAFVTNYAYWIAVRRINDESLDSELFGRVELLICDEAHLAAEELSRQLACWVGNQDFLRFAARQFHALVARSEGLHGIVSDLWRTLLCEMRDKISVELDRIAADKWSGVHAIAARRDKQYKRLSRLLDGIMRVLAHSEDGNWIWREAGPGYRFECVWPGKYVQQYLWAGVPRVILLSATLRPKALQLLGLMPTSVPFKEIPRQFPAENGPVWWVPTGRMRRSDDEGLERSIARTDELAEAWREYKGIIHTSSYKYAQQVKERSKYGNRMLINEQGMAVATADRFRASGPGSILISPSYGTGWDFPDEQCVWQQVNKLPFADKSDPVVEARMNVNKGWYDYDCAQKLVQRCGRGTRHYDDKCCTIITDDVVQSFRHYAKEHMPQWFRVVDWKRPGVPGPATLNL